MNKFWGKIVLDKCSYDVSHRKVEISCITSTAIKTDDGSPKTRKVGPPPLKPGVDYVNPEEEDQMVIISSAHS